MNPISLHNIHLGLYFDILKYGISKMIRSSKIKDIFYNKYTEQGRTRRARRLGQKEISLWNDQLPWGIRKRLQGWDRSLHNHEETEAKNDKQAATWKEEEDQDTQSLNCGQSTENKQGKQMEEHDEYDERSSTNEETASGKQEQRNKDAMKEKKREQVNNREELITGQNEQ